MRRGELIAGVLAAVPVVLFAALLAFPAADATLGSHTSHFVIVSVVSLLALCLAVAVLKASRALPDPRTLFLSLGFLSMAAIFLAHGLGTSPLFEEPERHAAHDAAETYGGAYASAGITAASADGPDTPAARMKVVGYSAQMSLLVSAMFFALAVVEWPDRVSRRLVEWRWAIIALLSGVLGGHVFAALWYPQLVAWMPLDSTPVSRGLAIGATAAFLLAAFRFFQGYRFALLPVQGALAFAMVMLIQAQWMMVLGPPWQLSWWFYHIAMLVGFSVGVTALLRQYRVTGDLATIVEGLFLREKVRGIRAGDPHALEAIGAAVAAKDTETADHIGRVADLSAAVGARLWLPDDRIEVVRLAGRLHDVGKIGVPNHILRKAGPLTPDEFEVMKLHTTRGWEIARRSGILEAVAPIIRAHHERLDGTGYPDGLQGDMVPIEARIVAVADVWDALTCDRPYRKAMSHAEAAEILLEEANDKLDPRCVESLLRILGLQHALRRAA